MVPRSLLVPHVPACNDSTRQYNRSRDNLHSGNSETSNHLLRTIALLHRPIGRNMNPTSIDLSLPNIQISPVQFTELHHGFPLLMLFLSPIPLP